MNLFRHWKMILGLVAIFIAGIGTGVIGIVFIVHHTITHPEKANQWVDARMVELDRHLKLTPEQKPKIRAIVEKSSIRIRSIIGNGFMEVVQTGREAHDEMIKELTPAQQVELEKIDKEIQKRLRDLASREVGKMPAKKE